MVTTESPPHVSLRSLHVGTLVLAAGRGGWYACLAVFATRSLGLSPTVFGVSLTAGGLTALVTGGLIGYLADRVGLRRMLVLLVLAQGFVCVGYGWASEPWAFVLVSSVVLTAERSVPALRIALVAGLSSGEERVRHLSSLRVAQSAGMALGVGVGGLALYLDSRPAYLGLLFLYAAAALVSAFVLRTVPRVPSLAERGVERRALVTRDRPFLVVTVLCTVLALNWGMFSSGVPLWIAAHTGAPLWIIGVLMVLNTVTIVVFQHRASRGSDTVRGAARACAWSAIPFAVACALYAATYHRSGALAVALLVGGTLAHVIGEVLFVAGSWGLAVSLTRQEAHGEYQGVFNTGAALAIVFAPALMTALLIEGGVGGWFVLAGLFLVTGLSVPAAARWASSSDLAGALAATSDGTGTAARRA